MLDRLNSKNVHCKSPRIGYEGGCVAVIGGGDSALDAALTVLGRNGRVVLVVREATPIRKPDTLARVRDAGGTIRTSTEIGAAAFAADGLRLSLTNGDEVDCSAVVVQIGFLAARRPSNAST